MPCYDGSKQDRLREDIDELRKQNDYLTRLLCDTCRRFEQADMAAAYGDAPSKEVQAWYKMHKADDDARIERDARIKVHEGNVAAARERLLNQLTPLELEAVGLRPPGSTEF